MLALLLVTARAAEVLSVSPAGMASPSASGLPSVSSLPAKNLSHATAHSEDRPGGAARERARNSANDAGNRVGSPCSASEGASVIVDWSNSDGSPLLLSLRRIARIRVAGREVPTGRFALSGPNRLTICGVGAATQSLQIELTDGRLIKGLELGPDRLASLATIGKKPALIPPAFEPAPEIIAIKESEPRSLRSPTELVTTPAPLPAIQKQAIKEERRINPYLAAGLSLLLPGAGEVYAGVDPILGSGLLAGGIALDAFTMAGALTGNSRMQNLGTAGVSLLAVGSAVDAYLFAKRSPKPSSSPSKPKTP